MDEKYVESFESVLVDNVPEMKLKMYSANITDATLVGFGSSQRIIDSIAANEISTIDVSKPPPATSAPPSESIRMSKLFFAAILTVGLNSVALGSVIGYASPMIADINVSRAPYHLLDSGAISWATSISACGMAVGCALVGIPMDVFGRKRVILFNSLPLICGWIIIAASNDITWLLVGRFLTGLSSGLVPIAVPIYLAEISPAHIRGRICSMGPAFMNLGVLYVACFACFLHYNWLTVACAAVPAIMVAIFVFMPETPRWLEAKGYTEAAKESLTRLRSAETDINIELNAIRDMLAKQKGEVAFVDFFKPSAYKPLLIMITLIWFQMFGGYGVVFVYSVSIFASAHLQFSPYVQSSIMCFVGLMAQFLSAMLVDRLGRKALLMWSATIMAMSMATMGAYEACCRAQIPSLAWMDVMCLLFYIFGLGLGFGPIPIYIGSEMFPGRMRGSLASIAICCWAIFFFLTTKFFLIVQNSVHTYGVYWIFAAVMVSSILFVKFFTPETKGKSLEEVQKLFDSSAVKSSYIVEKSTTTV